MKCIVTRASDRQINHPLVKNERNTAPWYLHPAYEYDAEINTLDELCGILRIDPNGAIMSITDGVCHIMIYDCYVE